MHHQEQHVLLNNESLSEILARSIGGKCRKEKIQVKNQKAVEFNQLSCDKNLFGSTPSGFYDPPLQIICSYIARYYVRK